MIIPLIWLKDYINIEKSPHEIADSFTRIGLMLDKQIENNILDLEQRLNRADLLSITGCARDLAAFENLKFKEPKTTLKKGKKLNDNEKVDIKIKSDNVNRFYTRVFKDIEVKESPTWLKERINQYGIPSINNIVDVTNFVMVELGQPMHAQDLDKFDKKEIVIRKAKKNEKITTLIGESVNLDNNTEILSQNKEPIAIMGIVGGKKTGVTKATKNFILDAGNYNQEIIRKSSRRLKIHNETVSRYDKYLDPRLAKIAIDRATYLIQKLAGGEYFENGDYYPTPNKPQSIKLRIGRLNSLSGKSFKVEDVKPILSRLGYIIIEQAKNVLVVEIPYFRTDIEVEDDIISDILRMNDYNTINSIPLNSTPPKNITPELIKFKSKIRDIMLNLGADEHITDPIVKKTNNSTQVILENSLSEDKSALRVTIHETLKLVVPNYPKHNIDQTFLFEIGRTYKQLENKKIYSNLQEQHSICVIYLDSKLDLKSSSLTLRKHLSTILKSLGIVNFKINKEGNQYNLLIKNEQIGNISYDNFELNLEKLLKHHKFTTDVTTEFERYKNIDISINLSDKENIGDIQNEIKKISDCHNIPEILEHNTLKGKRTLLVRIQVNPNIDLEKLSERIVNSLESKFKVSVRSKN